MQMDINFGIKWLDKKKYWWILDKELKENEFNSWMIRLQKCI